MDKTEEKFKILISALNNENTELIISFLNSSFSNQKSFIDLIQQLINNSFSEISTTLSILYKLNKILPDIIHNIGIPLCELLNEKTIIINYYYNLYLQNDSSNKNILINFINIFNFESSEKNPVDNLFEKLQYKEPFTCSILKSQKRNNKTEIEILYDEITTLFSNIRIKINNKDKFDKENYNSCQYSIKEKLDKIKKLETENKYPKALIEYFQEKIENLLFLFNKINKEQNRHNEIKTESVFKGQNNNSEFNIDVILQKLRDIPLKNRTSFYKDEQLSQGEDEFTEFKNYYLPLTEEKGNELKRQFCAFLNNKGGRLYLGINDQKIVKGVILDYKMRDELRNLLVNFTYDFYPKCRLDKIKVYFIPVKNMKDNKFINDLFVVKIIILQGEPFILYSMTNKGFNSAIRLQGQCANLTAEEITNEIIRRGKLADSNKIENLNLINNQFNDPEPEINYENEPYNKESSNSSEENINHHKEKNIKINNKDIFVVEVKNIDQNLDIKDVYDKFEDCGSIYKKFFSKNGKSKGYGLLKFSNENMGISAIKKMNNLLIGGKRISLSVKNKSNFF